ncbi:MAG: polyphosphate kinase 1, partial [Saprospiraceae bacterium]
SGQRKTYISSADWMVRNLHFRIEVAFPIFSEKLKKELMDILELQLKDNVKSRNLAYQHINEYVKNDEDKKIRSQIETYKYYKSLLRITQPSIEE